MPAAAVSTRTVASAQPFGRTVRTQPAPSCRLQVLQATGTQGLYDQAVHSQSSVVQFANTVRAARACHLRMYNPQQHTSAWRP